MNFAIPNFLPAAAEIFVAVMVLLSLLLTTFVRERQSARALGYGLAQISLLGACVIVVVVMPSQAVLTFSDLFIADSLAGFLKLMILFAVIVSLLYGRDYLAVRKMDRPEFFMLVQLMALGMMVLVGANHMLTVYIGLEMMSLPLYALIAFDRDNARATEAAMKYFVLGSLASGMLLYGMSMVYGATGTMDLSVLMDAASRGIGVAPESRLVLAFGLVFLVCGIAFKLGIAPFHMWVPDVYQGAPTAVTLLIAGAPKLAALGMAMRLLAFGMADLMVHWQHMLIVLAVASIVLGNLAAIVQTNIKRMLAYSGISHMGFVLLALLSARWIGSEQTAGDAFALLGLQPLPLTVNAYSAALFYAVAYVVMTLAAFGTIVLLSRSGFEADTLDDFKGLNRRSRWFAGMMMFTMLSMAGIPFFVGFIAKLAVLQAVVQAGGYWLAVLAVVMSVIGAFYYLRVVKLMYFDAPQSEEALVASPDVRFLLSVNGIGIAVLGLVPQWLLDMCLQALPVALS